LSKAEVKAERILGRYLGLIGLSRLARLIGLIKMGVQGQNIVNTLVIYHAFMKNSLLSSLAARLNKKS